MCLQCVCVYVQSTTVNESTCIFEYFITLASFFVPQSLCLWLKTVLIFFFSSIGTNYDPQERNGNYCKKGGHFTHLSQQRWTCHKRPAERDKSNGGLPWCLFSFHSLPSFSLHLLKHEGVSPQRTPPFIAHTHLPRTTAILLLTVATLGTLSCFVFIYCL